MTKLLITAAYAVYVAFWVRFFAHAHVWWKAVRRLREAPAPARTKNGRAWALSVADVFLFARLLTVNPALWLGEWMFHVSFLLVLLRHLRFFLDPVPSWVWALQWPGLIAGYVLPCSLIYILIVRLLSRREKYASPSNMALLGLVLVISTIGLLMRAWFTPNLIDAKMFALGLLCFKPAPAPESLLFVCHFSLVLVSIVLIPTHIFTAPFVMLEARKREQALYGVMHERK